MAQNFSPGDYLVFQLESGYGLLRVVSVDTDGGNTVWHLAAYDMFFLDVEHAEKTIASGDLSDPSHDHLALTNRAFESTQVARLLNVELTDSERAGYLRWLDDPDRVVSDRSVRLMLGLR